MCKAQRQAQRTSWYNGTRRHRVEPVPIRQVIVAHDALYLVDMKECILKFYDSCGGDDDDARKVTKDINQFFKALLEKKDPTSTSEPLKALRHY